MSLLDTHPADVTRQQCAERGAHARHQWRHIGHPVRCRFEDDHGDARGRDVLLIPEVAIDGAEDGESLRLQTRQQHAVLATPPAEVQHMDHVQSGLLAHERAGRALIEQDAHLATASFGDQQCGTEIQRGDGLLARDRWEVRQEGIQQVATFEKVQKRLHFLPRRHVRSRR
jgi:hypothetical protein